MHATELRLYLTPREFLEADSSRRTMVARNKVQKTLGRRRSSGLMATQIKVHRSHRCLSSLFTCENGKPEIIRLILVLQAYTTSQFIFRTRSIGLRARLASFRLACRLGLRHNGSGIGRGGSA